MQGCAELVFFEQDDVGRAGLISRLTDANLTHVYVIGNEDQAVALSQVFERNRLKSSVLAEADSRLLTDSTAVVILESEEGALSRRLMQFVDVTGGMLCAPVTGHFMAHRSVFTNGLMKSGTHLLQKLMDAFGFEPPRDDELPSCHDEVRSGHYYNLQHMTRLYLARPIGKCYGFISAFCRSPVVFIVRDPRDVVVSLAHYLAAQKDYHLLSAYFEGMGHEERISSVIQGRYPVPIYVNRETTFSGSIRDLYLTYLDWIRFPLANTVIVSYEDLVGARGGGSEARRIRSIWALQLALHVPGSPRAYAERMSPASVTFRKGEIAAHEHEFTDRNRREFMALEQDFMQSFGYGAGDVAIRYPYFKDYAGQIVLVEPSSPQLLEQGYCGFNIVRYKGEFVGIAQSLGAVDLTQMDDLSWRTLCQQHRIVVNPSLGLLKAELSAHRPSTVRRSLAGRIKRKLLG